MLNTSTRPLAGSARLPQSIAVCMRQDCSDQLTGNTHHFLPIHTYGTYIFMQPVVTSLFVWRTTYTQSHYVLTLAGRLIFAPHTLLRADPDVITKEHKAKITGVRCRGEWFQSSDRHLATGRVCQLRTTHYWYYCKQHQNTLNTCVQCVYIQTEDCTCLLQKQSLSFALRYINGLNSNSHMHTGSVSLHCPSAPQNRTSGPSRM